MDHQQVATSFAVPEYREEVHSSYVYPKRYKGPKPIADQVHALADLFSLERNETLRFAQFFPPLPMGAEGWFAIPKVSALARRHFPQVEDPHEQQCKALQLAHTLLPQFHAFENYSNIVISPKIYKLTKRTLHAIHHLEAKQPGDIIIVAAQHGLRHRGRSAEKVEDGLKNGPEFCLASFMGCCMAMTHPERYKDRSGLGAEFPGDRFTADPRRPFATLSHLSFSGKKLGWGVGDANDAYERFGCVTGFVM